MWFGNFKHNVYQLASFHVQLRLGKEEAQQMRVKVRCFRRLCPVGLWWGFISKTVPLNPPKLGVGTSCCSPRGNGKRDCCKSSFAMKHRMPNHSHLCSWRQVSPIGVRRSRSKLLPPRTCFIFRSYFPPSSPFFSSINICKNVGNVSVYI